MHQVSHKANELWRTCAPANLPAHMNGTKRDGQEEREIMRADESLRRKRKIFMLLKGILRELKGRSVTAPSLEIHSV